MIIDHFKNFISYGIDRGFIDVSKIDKNIIEDYVDKSHKSIYKLINDYSEFVIDEERWDNYFKNEE